MLSVFLEQKIKPLNVLASFCTLIVKCVLVKKQCNAFYYNFKLSLKVFILNTTI